MTVYSGYLLALALLFTGTTVALALTNQHQLGLYLALYLLEYLAATLLFTYIHPQARRLLTTLGYVLFLGFVAMAGVQVAQLLVTAPS